MTSLQLFIGLLIHISTSPLLSVWRLSLYLLLPIAAYKPAVSHYQKYRYSRPMVKLVGKRQFDIICTILHLLLSILLALALFEKSFAYFVPSITTHFGKTQYKHDHDRAWHSELLLHLAGFVLSCVPFFSVLGVAAGMLFYTRQARIYGRLGKKMVTGKLEARESFVADVEDEGMGRFMVAEEQGIGESSVSAPPPAVIPARQATVVRYKRNRYTSAGVMSIWGSRYDGRGVQRSNLQEDIEMAEGVGRGDE